MTRNKNITMDRFEPIIGLEIHVQLKTNSKMFCGCSTDYRSDPPNTHCCPVCLGLPGALPVPNKRAIEQTILMGLALNCQINKHSYFSRKNYFYPDLSKGYQITQYDKPFCYQGKFAVNGKTIRITRIHLEEDTGKSLHVSKPGGREYTLLDFNKSGIPLMELVTEPDFHNAEDVFVFAKKIRQIVRYLDISDGDMEKGNLRVEPNISLRQVQNAKIKNQNDNVKFKINKEELPTYKVEIKNLNSFASLKKGVEYEIERQRKILEKGETPKQETRGWDEKKGVTFSQRSKEEAHDYRYFPEPDIPPIEIEESNKQKNIKTLKQKKGSTEDGIFLDEIRRRLPELPNEKIRRFVTTYKITEYDAEVIVAEKEIADWFEAVVRSLKNKALGKKAANWIVTEVLSRIKGQELSLSADEAGIKEFKVTPSKLAKIVEYVEGGKISRESGKEILEILITSGGKIDTIIKEKGLEKVSEVNILEPVVKKVIVANPKAVVDYQSGKKESLQFLIGMVMRETKGRAEIKKILNILKKELDR